MEAGAAESASWGCIMETIGGPIPGSMPVVG